MTLTKTMTTTRITTVTLEKAAQETAIETKRILIATKTWTGESAARSIGMAMTAKLLAMTIISTMAVAIATRSIGIAIAIGIGMTTIAIVAIHW